MTTAIGRPTAARSGRRQPALRRGVNLVGYLRTESGVGAAARGYVRAVRTLGVPLSLWDVSGLQANRAQDATPLELAQAAPYDVNVVIADVELHYALAAHLGEGFFRGRTNVAVWAWELPRFPAKWSDRFAFYDEIWGGTSFVVNALAERAPVPVVRVPPAVTPVERGSRQAGRRRVNAAPHEFVFLYVFDFRSHAERKDPLAAVEAFAQAFGPLEPARLVLKCVNAAAKPDDFARLTERARGLNVTVLDGYWPAGEIRDLMEACDAYVSLHRAEGTGLTIADAMALAKPVIATGWSGNTDFMSVANAYPVRFRPTELAQGVGPYPAGSAWAQPCVAHAAELMRQVYRDRAGAADRGRAAAETMARDYSEATVADLIGQRLRAARIRRRLRAFRARAWAEFRRYRQLPERLRATASAMLPPGATVLVVSKGDDALLDLGGPAAWHFPRGQGGAYAGHYPADADEAVAHLEALRGQGAAYLLLPSTAFWWLDHYAGLRRHLDGRHRRTYAGHDCIIYELCGPAAGGK